MSDFLTVFGAALAAHAVAIISAYIFYWYSEGRPEGHTGVKFFDTVLTIGLRGTAFLIGLIILAAGAYVVYLLALDTLRIWGLWE